MDFAPKMEYKIKPIKKDSSYPIQTLWERFEVLRLKINELVGITNKLMENFNKILNQKEVKWEK